MANLEKRVADLEETIELLKAESPAFRAKLDPSERKANRGKLINHFDKVKDARLKKTKDKIKERIKNAKK